jgi:hypothetical protein
MRRIAPTTSSSSSSTTPPLASSNATYDVLAGGDEEAQQQQPNDRIAVATEVIEPDPLTTTTTTNNNNTTTTRSTNNKKELDEEIVMGIPVPNPTTTTTSTTLITSAISSHEGKIINVMHTLENTTYRIVIPGQNPTVRDLRLAIFNLTNIPSDRQRLIYNGRFLTGDDQLLTMIPEQGYVHLVVSVANNNTNTDSSADIPDAVIADATMTGNDPFAIRGFPIDLQQVPTRNNNNNQQITRDETIEFVLAPLRPWCYVIIVWFSLVFWGALSSLTDPRFYNNNNNDQTINNSTSKIDGNDSLPDPIAIQLADLVIGFAGICVGVLGTMATSTSWSRVDVGNIDRNLVLRRLKIYRISIGLLGTVYVLRITIGSLIGTNDQYNLSTLFFVILYMTLLFSFCVARTKRAEMIVQREIVPVNNG